MAGAARPQFVLDYLNRAREYLERHRVDTPRLDAEVLLAHVLGCARIDLYAGFDRPLVADEVDRYRALVQKRGSGEPVAYLTGHREFYSLDFRVTPSVLIPRPETEHLVEAALAALPADAAARVVDVGTGSGCVAIAVARHRPGTRVIATDLSRPALEVARENVRRLGVGERVSLVQADALDALTAPGVIGLILSNPPYIPPGERQTLPREVRDHEPEVALHCRDRGTRLHRRLVAAAPGLLEPGGALFMEIGEGQAEAVSGWIEEAFGNVTVINDLAGLPRVVGGKKKA